MKEKPLDLYRRLLREQREWIEKCENGVSYKGQNGNAVREADAMELRRIQEKLSYLEVSYLEAQVLRSPTNP